MDDFDFIVPDLEDAISRDPTCAPACSPASAIGVGSLDGHGTTVESIHTDVSDSVFHPSVGKSSSGVDSCVYDRALMESHLSNSHAALPKFCWGEGMKVTFSEVKYGVYPTL